MNILIDEQKFKENYQILSDYEFDFEMEKRCIDYIKNKKGNQLSCMRTLSSEYKVLASKNLLIENNLNSFRLNCHISEKLKILGTSKESRLYKASYSLFGLIMSNNKEWISFLKNNLNYTTSNDFNSKENTYIPFEPIKQGMGVRTDTPLDDEMEDLAPILKSQNSKTERKNIIRYGMTFFDKVGGYLMFAIDKDTLVNHAPQYDPNVPDDADASERMITTLQIFKRIPDDPKPPQNKSPVPSKDE